MINFRGAATLLAFLALGSAQAADLPGQFAMGGCPVAGASSLAFSPVEQIEDRVADFYADASAALDSQGVLLSRSPAYLWAREARFQCGKAISYLNGGHVDVQSVQKCDCAHARLAQYR